MQICLKSKLVLSSFGTSAGSAKKRGGEKTEEIIIIIIVIVYDFGNIQLMR
jgi:hypothetical protein